MSAKFFYTLIVALLLNGCILQRLCHKRTIALCTGSVFLNKAHAIHNSDLRIRRSRSQRNIYGTTTPVQRITPKKIDYFHILWLRTSENISDQTSLKKSTGKDRHHFVMQPLHTRTTNLYAEISWKCPAQADFCSTSQLKKRTPSTSSELPITSTHT